MSENHFHTKFGIQEIYFHKGFPYDLLEKLHYRAVYALDAEDKIAKRYITYDMILIFQKQVPTHSQIYRFIESLDKFANKQDFIDANTLLNEDELLSAIKSKNFVLVTHRILLKQTHSLQDNRDQL